MDADLALPVKQFELSEPEVLVWRIPANLPPLNRGTLQPRWRAEQPRKLRLLRRTAVLDGAPRCKSARGLGSRRASWGFPLAGLDLMLHLVHGSRDIEHEGE